MLMPAHKRKTAITGSRMRHNTTYVSSGITSLDHLIGGGMPVGSTYLIEQDILGSYARVMCKYFLAEGVACNHALFLASADEDPELLLRELPKPTEKDEDLDNLHHSNEKMVIAWRYEHLEPVNSSYGTTATLGRNFDLSRHIDYDVAKERSVELWFKQDVGELECNLFKNPLYGDLIRRINEHLEREEFKRGNNKQNLLRILITGLGGPMWMAQELDSSQELDSEGKDLAKFMCLLKTVIMEKNALALVACPSHLFQSELTSKVMISLADTAVRLESFAGSDRETNPAFKEYHGLFYLNKTPSFDSIMPYTPDCKDFAFKLRRKKFLIEKLHLPPELEESQEREQDDMAPTSSSSCGTFGKKSIDF